MSDDKAGILAFTIIIVAMIAMGVVAIIVSAPCG